MDFEDKSNCILSCMDKYGSATVKQQPRYIKVDGDVIVNEKHVRWVKRLHDCMYICMKTNSPNTEAIEFNSGKFEPKSET